MGTWGPEAEPSTGEVRVVEVPIGTLQLGPSVRFGDDDEAHIALLVEAGGGWPPILVHQGSGTIIDGRYRYLAAMRLGWERIVCELFEGDAEDAFIESVRRNVTHGRPLTLAERKHAARCLLTAHPEWSDRRVAELCALAKGTVGRVREQTGDDSTVQPMRRLGLDGKWRPVGAKDIRRDIEAALRDHPDASLRQIARISHSTVETVRSVKRALSERALARSQAAESAAGGGFDDWFARTSSTAEWRTYAETIPAPRLEQVLEDARRRAADWLQFADVLRRRLELDDAVELPRAASM